MNERIAEGAQYIRKVEAFLQAFEQDRRRAPRHEKQIPVSLLTRNRLTGDVEAYPATLRNISNTGMLLECHRDFQPGVTLEVTIPAERPTGFLRCLNTVRRVNRLDSHLHTIAIEVNRILG